MRKQSFDNRPAFEGRDEDVYTTALLLLIPSVETLGYFGGVLASRIV